MPVITRGGLSIDHTDEGRGPTVILIHSSVSGNRQWRLLTEALKGRYRVLAINLYGYGETTPWPGTATQSLYAQAQLVLALCEDKPGPVHLVGHSFGAAVALKAASLLGPRVGSLTLLEPIPFHLLRHAGRKEAYLEARELRDHVQCYGALGEWPKAAQWFADYWLGAGSWGTMPQGRRERFTAGMQPNMFEWDAVMEEQTPVAEWWLPGVQTLVVSDRATRLPVREIVELFAQACPHWNFQFVAEGGHMAPVTHPDLVNPIVREFLDSVAQ